MKEIFYSPLLGPGSSSFFPLSPSTLSPFTSPSPLASPSFSPRSSSCSTSGSSHSLVSFSSCSSLILSLYVLDSSSANRRASLVCRESSLPSISFKRLTVSSFFSSTPTMLSSRMPIFIRICRPFSSRILLASGNSVKTPFRSSLERQKRSECPMLLIFAVRLFPDLFPVGSNSYRGVGG
ncbi:hypothetical protein AOXY_G8462 [Acipenser oxyrinchus oxyrinchus]|uniref:Uncharacterized protein n=1 Tax=Acipenser oxyrinchus oxyrinchus TaxID=40147 RepID=A0AAD8G810_ACIOX|nr:hypothetical protein AOXY_G8462 [Acipenser oxyrinchus oxyrinchus]